MLREKRNECNYSNSDTTTSHNSTMIDDDEKGSAELFQSDLVNKLKNSAYSEAADNFIKINGNEKVDDSDKSSSLDIDEDTVESDKSIDEVVTLGTSTSPSTQIEPQSLSYRNFDSSLPFTDESPGKYAGTSTLPFTLLTDMQDKVLRKERNKMHAKLSRDRSKLFNSKIQEVISALERFNKIMYNRLKASTKLKYFQVNECNKDPNKNTIWLDQTETVDFI
jgi:hypothetical protein